jgi:hypothetical protein
VSSDPTTLAQKIAAGEPLTPSEQAFAAETIIAPAAEAVTPISADELSRWVDGELTPRLNALNQRLSELERLASDRPQPGRDSELEREVVDEVGRQVTPLYARLADVEQALNARLDSLEEALNEGLGSFAARLDSLAASPPAGQRQQTISEGEAGGFSVTAPSYGPEPPPADGGGE